MSTDNIYLNTQQAPHQIRYSQLCPLAFSAKSSMKNYYSSNQSTYNQNNLTINIPLSSGSDFIDGQASYLRFDYKNLDVAVGGVGAATNGNHSMANSANCLIARIKIVADSGKEAELINYYNLNHAVISDIVLGPMQRATKLQEGYGTWGKKPVLQTHANYDLAGAHAALAGGEIEINMALLSAYGETATAAPYWGCDEATILPGNTQTFCLPLDLSSILGPTQKRFWPLFLQGLRLEITLDPYGPCSTLVTPPKFEVSTVMFCAQSITFNNGVNEALLAMSRNSGIYMHGCTFSNSMVPIASGTTASWSITDKRKSVKSIFFFFQDGSYIGKASARNSHRVTNKLKSYQFKIGSEYLPNSAIRCTQGDATGVSNGQFIVENWKAVGMYGDNNHNSMLNCYNMGGNEAFALNTTSRAVFSLDCDNFGRSESESGISTVLNNPVIITTESSAGFGAALNAVTLLYHDVVFHISPTGDFSVDQ